MKVRLYFDGACNNHAKQKGMGIGLAVYLDGEYDASLSRAIGVNEGWEGDHSTSNIAEWLGCVEAMKMASDIKNLANEAMIEVYSDSQVITSQFNGNYSIKKPEFFKYYTKAKQYSKNARVRLIKWIPRALNKQADILSKQGLNNLK